MTKVKSSISSPFAILAFDLFDPKLDLMASDYRVYAQIYKRGHGSEQGCTQRLENLCKEAGVSKRQFINSANKLVALGALIKSKGKKNTTHYQVVVDPREWKPNHSVNDKTPSFKPDQPSRVVHHSAPSNHNEWCTPVHHSSAPQCTIHTPLPNNKDLTRSLELDPVCRHPVLPSPKAPPHQPSKDTPSGARDSFQNVYENVEVEIKPIKATLESSEGKRIDSPYSGPRKASNESIEGTYSSVEVLKYPILIREWALLLEEAQPHRRNSVNREAWDKALSRVAKYTQKDEQGLLEVFEFIKNDHRPVPKGEKGWPGWRTNAMSPAGLMDTLKSGERKIDKILIDMENAKNHGYRLSKSEVKMMKRQRNLAIAKGIM